MYYEFQLYTLTSRSTQTHCNSEAMNFYEPVLMSALSNGRAAGLVVWHADVSHIPLLMLNQIRTATFTKKSTHRSMTFHDNYTNMIELIL